MIYFLPTLYKTTEGGDSLFVKSSKIRTQGMFLWKQVKKLWLGFYMTTGSEFMDWETLFWEV